ncbi:MAG TPA: hypothetical protein VIT38_06585 [Allosphingosinicella sp.]
MAVPVRFLILLCLGLAGASAGAQNIVTSSRPDRVAVTVYRDPNRSAETPPNLQWMNGYALISETRRIAIPGGMSEIRFEGVAGGILPQSAIVTGLPEGLIERNRDAYLLSPGTLLDRSLGRRVHLRRTSRATGAVVEQEAVVRSGAGGAVVLQTEEGFEALRCTGLAETPVYDEVPPGLSARPTLSVRARATRAVEATITLSYIASGFDWQANYVATLSPMEDRLDLFAWLTLANGDETGFADADTQAVAGQVNHRNVRAQPSEASPLILRCWPHGTTSDIVAEGQTIVVTGSRVAATRGMVAGAPPPPSPPPPPPPPALMAEQEALGDLKLYRIPEPVTVAARSQKQVALLQRPDVRVRMVYRQRLFPSDSSVAMQARCLLITRNSADEGLGLPLPSGRLMLFADAGTRPILIGQGTVTDRAVGEDVEIELGPAPGVRTQLTLLSRENDVWRYELVVTNDRAEPVAFEGEFDLGNFRVRPEGRLGRRNGRPLWQVMVPANGNMRLRYRLDRRN